MYGWSIKSFNMLLQLLRSVFPHIDPIPSSWINCKQLLKYLGLEYDRIDAYPNDGMLYWGEKERQESCDKSGSSRWRNSEKKLPAKVLCYFPLIPGLLFLCKSSNIAKVMIWPDKHRARDEILSHPIDAKAWKEFDE